jgi:hypothetical protein
MPSGSAARNVEPIIQALTPLLSDIPASSSTPVVSASSRPRILELASYPYEHIAVFAKEWEDWEWWGTARDEKEIRSVSFSISTMS